MRRFINLQVPKVMSTRGSRKDEASTICTKLQDIETSLEGTTAIAFISPNAIDMASDQRAITLHPNPNGQFLIPEIVTDQWSKIYRIDGRIVATAAGASLVCREFRKVAVNVNRAAFGGVSAPEGAYLVARTVMASMDNWELRNPGHACPAEFIVIGYHGDLPLVFWVRPSSRGGIECESRVGHGTCVGSGRGYAAEFVQTRQRDLHAGILVESAVVAASLQCGSTGGHVERATLPIGGNEVVTFWNPPFSVIQLLERDLNRYRVLLENSLFFFCRGMPYNNHNEQLLLRALRQRFPWTITRTHVICFQTGARIMTLDGDYPTWEVLQYGPLIPLEIQEGIDIELLFVEPNQMDLQTIRETAGQLRAA